jgi:hypothetical protein
MQVHRHQREVDVVTLGDGAAGPVLVDVTDLEILVLPADLATVVLVADDLHLQFPFMPWRARSSIVRTLIYVRMSVNLIRVPSFPHDA